MVIRFNVVEHISDLKEIIALFWLVNPFVVFILNNSLYPKSIIGVRIRSTVHYDSDLGIVTAVAGVISKIFIIWKFKKNFSKKSSRHDITRHETEDYNQITLVRFRHFVTHFFTLNSMNFYGSLIVKKLKYYALNFGHGPYHSP